DSELAEITLGSESSRGGQLTKTRVSQDAIAFGMCPPERGGDLSSVNIRFGRRSIIPGSHPADLRNLRRCLARSRHGWWPPNSESLSRRTRVVAAESGSVAATNARSLWRRPLWTRRTASR